MAKKVVASLQTEGNKFTKVISLHKTKKGAYAFKESIMAKEDVEQFLKNKNNDEN